MAEQDSWFKPGHGNEHIKASKKPRVRGGLARSTRSLIGDEGLPLVQLWWSIANDPMRRDADRLEASRLLAERGWGKAANWTPQEGDPLGLEDVEYAAEEFRRSILRLAPLEGEGEAAPEGADPPGES